MSKGRVFLAGAGPGDERLISVRALELLKDADVIVYDRLAGKRLLKNAKKNCELIDVGKRPDKHIKKQIEINQILIQKAKEGKKVLRLKGGDPFIFGRGGEEAEALCDAGIEFEIIPGISSFYSACAYEGIPITHREYASSFHVFTGHKENDIELDFNAIAKLQGTIVFLMSMKRLSFLCNQLIENGKSADTPSAIIQWGTTSRQKIAEGKLSTIAEIAQKEEISNPAVVVIGNVVSARNKIQWQKYRPLWQKKILITRSEVSANAFHKRLAEQGAEVFEFPVNRIGKPDSFVLLDEAIDIIEQFTWIFFTSVNGVESFFSRLAQKKIDIRRLYQAKIFCIGKTTEKALNDRGIFVDRLPSCYHSESAIKEMNQFITKEDVVLFPVSEIAKTEMADAVRNIGAACHMVTAYTNKKNIEYDNCVVEEIKNNYYDVIVLASSSQVKSLYDLVGTEIGNTKICVIGKMTADTAVALGMPVHKIAELPDTEHLCKAVKELLIK